MWTGSNIHCPICPEFHVFDKSPSWDLWRILQSATRGRLRSFGFTSGELSCHASSFYSQWVWHANPIIWLILWFLIFSHSIFFKHLHNQLTQKVVWISLWTLGVCIVLFLPLLWTLSPFPWVWLANQTSWPHAYTFLLNTPEIITSYVTV